MKMPRRDFIKTAGLAAASAALATGTKGADENVVVAAPEPTGTSQRLSVKQLRAWQDLEYGMFICFGMHTFGRSEGSRKGEAPIEHYNPERLDVEQWVLVAKDAGMKYAILTCKQVDGFALWPSEYTDYSVKNSKDTTDVVGEFVAACRKHGIEPGIYYCAWDNHHKFGSKTPDKSEDYMDSVLTPTEAEPLDGAPFTTHLFQNFMTATIDEILDGYGPLAQFWIDIPAVLGNGYREFLYNHIAEKNPGIVIAMNHGLKKEGDELVFLPEKAWPTDVLEMELFSPADPYPPVWNIKGKDRYFPGEMCETLGEGWYWNVGDKPKPMDELVKTFQTCRDNRINLLLAVPPDRDGVIPARWTAPLMELKKKMGL